MSVSVKTYDFTIPPGGAFQIQAVGSYFRIQTTTGPVRVQGEFGDLSPLLAGQGIKDSPFTRLMFTNLSAVAITGTVIVADKEFVDQQMVLSGDVNVTPSSKISNSSGGSYPLTISGSTTPWSGITASNKAFIVINGNPTANVFIAPPLAPTSAGIKITPGSYFYKEGLLCSMAWTIWSDTAGAAATVINYQ
jgi:hypothetical protein